MFRKFLSYSLILFVFSSCETPVKPEFKAEKFLSAGNRSYTQVSWTGFNVDITDVRPSMADSSIMAVVPIEIIQSLQKRKMGLTSFNGNCSPAGSFDESKKGGLLTEGGQSSILNLAADSSDLRALICQPGKSFMQQHLLMWNGMPQEVRASQSFQARCLVEYSDGKMAILESAQHLKMNQLLDDLKSLGVQNAFYLANGLFAQGWYHYGGAQITLGRVKSSSEPQKNWLIIQY